MRGVKASTSPLRVGAMGTDLEVEHGGQPAFAEPKVQPIQACRSSSWQIGGLLVWTKRLIKFFGIA